MDGGIIFKNVNVSDWWVLYKIASFVVTSVYCLCQIYGFVTNIGILSFEIGKYRSRNFLWVVRWKSIFSFSRARFMESF